MNLPAKKEFIYNLIESVKQDLINNAHRFPEEWDGIEIRHLIAKKFDSEDYLLSKNTRGRSLTNKRRCRECENDIIIHNL